jgi:hypothetical protein
MVSRSSGPPAAPPILRAHRTPENRFPTQPAAKARRKAGFCILARNEGHSFAAERVSGDLAAQQDEDTCGDGQDRQDRV